MARWGIYDVGYMGCCTVFGCSFHEEELRIDLFEICCVFRKRGFEFLFDRNRECFEFFDVFQRFIKIESSNGRIGVEVFSQSLQSLGFGRKSAVRHVLQGRPELSSSPS